MIKRHHQVLAGLLIVQIALSIFSFWPRASTGDEAELLFADLAIEDVTRLTIEDAEGNLIQLEKIAGAWVLPDADDYPAQSAAVDSLLQNLTSLSTGRLVARSDASHRQLRVSPDDFVRRISLETSEGASPTIYLGSEPQYGSVHFRPSDQSETYLTSDLSTYEVSATVSMWIDTTYQRVPEDDVQRFTLENSGGTFAFERIEDDSWAWDGLGEDEKLDQTQVMNVLRRAASITMRAPVGREDHPRYGMDDPAALVTLETEEKTVTAWVGSRDAEDGSYFVKSSESEYYVRVAETGVSSLVESGRDTFLEEPPIPEEESDGT